MSDVSQSPFVSWLHQLEIKLRNRFGIGVGDIVDIESLHRDFMRGETLQQITDHLQSKWDLVDIRKSGAMNSKKPERNNVKIICCECKKVIKEGDGIDATASHALCPACLKLALKLVQEARITKHN